MQKIDGRSAFLDVALLLAFFIGLKAAVDPVTWKYSSPIAAVVTLAVAAALMRYRGMRWADYGFIWTTPSTLKEWSIFVAQILGVIILPTLAAYGVNALFGGIFAEPPSVNDRFAGLEGNLSMLLMWVSIAWVVGAFAEELIFRAFLINKLEAGCRALLGENSKKVAVIIAVVVSAVLFGLAHVYYRGMLGALTHTTVALVIGLLYLAYGRKLWPLIIAHGTINTLALVARYTGSDI